MSEIRTHFLTPTAVRITHAPPNSEIPPDRPWLSHVLLPQPPVAPEDAQLEVSLVNGLVHIAHHASRRQYSAAFTFHESAPPASARPPASLRRASCSTSRPPKCAWRTTAPTMA